MTNRLFGISRNQRKATEILNLRTRKEEIWRKEGKSWSWEGKGNWRGTDREGEGSRGKKHSPGPRYAGRSWRPACWPHGLLRSKLAGRTGRPRPSPHRRQPSYHWCWSCCCASGPRGLLVRWCGGTCVARRRGPCTVRSTWLVANELNSTSFLARWWARLGVCREKHQCCCGGRLCWERCGGRYYLS